MVGLVDIIIENVNRIEKEILKKTFLEETNARENVLVIFF